MAQYDGAIRIVTKIATEDAEESLSSLEYTIKKSAKEIDKLRQKMDALKGQKIPTEDYKKLQTELSQAEKDLSELVQKQTEWKDMGISSGATWDALNDKIAKTSDNVDRIKGRMQSLVEAGKGFTLGEDTVEYAAYARQIEYEEQAIVKAGEHYKKLQGNADAYRRLGETAKKSLDKVGNMLKRVNSHVDSFGKKLKEAAQKHLPLFRRETEKVKSSLSGFKGRIKSLALSLLIFNQISAAFRAASSAISEGFKNLYDDNERFKTSVDSLKASVLTLENAFAAAFRPIVDTAVPYIQKLVEWLTEAVNLAGQFFAALAGRKTYTRAIRQTAAASKEAAEAAEEETEAINRQLSPLDDLNTLTSENNREKDKGKDDAGSGVGTMFEEVPIDSSILDMVDKVKGVLSKLFVPIKEAWDREGKFVMDSWKYALDEVWKLIKDIGRDFLTIWQQAETVDIFADILHIIGDIGLVVGHLARNFREAWNENKTGLHILENIRDIIGAIIRNIRLAADKTVEWADKLDFGPLLEVFERFTESLIPLADALSGILSDFYTEVLLPLGKWTLEEGLPKLLDVFTDFNNKVDWQTLRENLAEFWRHLEPFSETVGEGLILFIERVSDALADFLNSQEFKDFLGMIENWMDSVTPEDVAGALEMIAKALIGLKLALLGFQAVSALAGVFGAIKSFIGIFTPLGSVIAKAAGVIAGGVGGITSSLMILGSMLSLVAAAVAGWKIGEWINEKLLGVDTPSFNEMMEGIKSSFTDGSWKEALHLWGEDIKAAWTEIWGYVKEDWNNCMLGEIIGSFTDGTWRDALALWGDDIYNAFVTLGERQEEWLASLKEKWSKTWSGIKEKISSAISSIKSTVGSAIDWIMGKLDSLKKSFNIGTGLAGGKLFGSGLSRSTGSIVYPANPAFAKLAEVEIPGYATGQVIPRTMKQHLAILGDNNRETEVVSPISTMKQAFIEALAEVGYTGNNNSGNVTMEIPVIISGIGEIGRAVQKFDMEFFKQTGRHAFT